MKIAIATDHRGVELKKSIIEALKSDYEFIDCSIKNYDDDDYPDFAFSVCKVVLSNDADFGVLICGTGNGMSIAANKINGIRSAVVHNAQEARLVRIDNDANIITFSSQLDLNNICECIKVFVSTDKEDGRHARRREKIHKIEIGAYDEL